jgi:hypothetical protein
MWIASIFSVFALPGIGFMLWFLRGLIRDQKDCRPAQLLHLRQKRRRSVIAIAADAQDTELPFETASAKWVTVLGRL